MTQQEEQKRDDFNILEEEFKNRTGEGQSFFDAYLLFFLVGSGALVALLVFFFR